MAQVRLGPGLIDPPMPERIKLLTAGVPGKPVLDLLYLFFCSRLLLLNNRYSEHFMKSPLLAPMLEGD